MAALNTHESDSLRRLGQRLTATRLQRNDRQGDFAARLGVSIPTYRKMEAGDPTVTIGYWIRALRLLDRLGDVEKLLETPASIFAQLEQRATVLSRKRAPRR